ncbi:MAG: histidine kinase [Candidatus Riflebacteria bacterium]|nr:histidine kinase [Candidatus Riflebacteria bacterium]
MGVVKGVSGRCKRCYTCVRNCPVKAICVEAGEAKVLEDFCVSCGTCVRVCNQKAKEVEDSTSAVMNRLAVEQTSFALIAPSFPASFYESTPKQVVESFRLLGFTNVVEVAYGAELIGRESKRLLADPAIKKPIITSPCPVVVGLIEKHFPELIEHLAPVVSPVLALARYLRSLPGYKDAYMVFVGPCIAKKAEIRDPEVVGLVNHVLTFREVKKLYKDKGIVSSQLPGTPFDPPYPGEGRVFPLMGGILKTGNIGTDILDPRIAIIEGYHETMEFLRNFKVSIPKQEIIDILYCRGCIDGVEIDSPLPFLEKRKRIIDLVGESRHLNPSSLPEVDLHRKFHDKRRKVAEPIEEEIIEVMQLFGKFSPEDELNCGACGYPTCREKARAVLNGFAEPEMCLPEIIKQLEKSVGELRISHDELKKAQDELVQSEKLASLGQLSAGVAHELNNPLGGILLFSNLLLERLREQQKEGGVPEEIEVIVKEATRCRNIVRGLLNFARQSKLQKSKIAVEELLSEILEIEKRSAPNNIIFVTHFDKSLPRLMLDPVQVRQAFTNIIHNAVEAMPDGGTLSVTTRYISASQQAEINFADTGTGISEEFLTKLFTPFFTTKGIGKGTGLGLAISYGIIKMHRGGITVQSAVSKGTTFTVLLPAEQEFEDNLLDSFAKNTMFRGVR